jgi:3-hydroxy acid dehydrogenase/malonic semialdehyde reductase
MILITGASAGIGEATAREFAKKKKNLWLIARRKDRLDRLAQELSKAHGVTVHTDSLDLQDTVAVGQWIKRSESRFSEVTVLVNNAGLAKGMKNFQELTWDETSTMVDTNIKGVLLMTQTVLPYFLKKNSGHIVNLGSIAGFWTYPKGNVYCMTKAAIRSLTETLRLDLIGTAIRVTEVSPGMVETEFSLVRLGDAAKAKQVYAGMTPLTPSDIAETIVWCTDRPAHVNIQEIILYPTDQASPTVVHRTTS